MRTLIALSVSITALLGAVQPVRALTLAHLWSQRFGSSSNDTGQSVAVDASGNIFATGFFSGTVNFGGANLMSAGLQDIFVAKYNAAGVHQWSQRFGSTNSDIGFSVAVDASGDVFVTGSFQGTVGFGGVNLMSAGFQDMFLAKYNAAGVHQWSQRFGSTSGDAGNSVVVDGSGNVFATGDFTGTVDFGGGNLVSAGGADIFVAKYNAGGLHLWSQRFGGALMVNDTGYSVAVDASGNIFATGRFFGTADFGGGNLVSAGDADIFVAKYSGASGAHQWSQRFGTSGPDIGYSVAVGAAGDVFATGSFFGVVSFGGGNLASAGSADIFVAKYNGAGVHQWSQRFGGSSFDEGKSVAVDPLGNVLATGSFLGTVSFGGVNLVSAGADEVFVARYNAAGAHQWSQRFGGTGIDRGNSVAADASGNVVATGRFQGTVDFGGGNLVSAGAEDIFLAKYAHPAEPVISGITDIGNDQGRVVKIRFARSGHDQPASRTPIAQYEAYRRDDAPPAITARRDPAGLSSEQLRADGWSFVGSAPAHSEESYGFDVPTIGDSTQVLGQYHSVFYVRASTAVPSVFFDSPPDSGYSLDNLAPGIPLNLVYDAGDLTWDESTAVDFDFFTVYGANTDAFGTVVVVDYSVAAAMDVSGSPYVFYYVTATDFSGNEGNPAKVNTLSGVGGAPRSYVLSVSNYPNPFNPGTTVSYTVPSRGAVTVAVYDARGARVATLINNEERAAGAYRADWDGRDDGGTTVSSGVYFARIEHASGTRSKKMMLLK